MNPCPSDYEHQATAIAEIQEKLRFLGADKAVLKMLPRNANDKNQIYFASSFTSLYKTFDLTLHERGQTSSTKETSKPGSNIPEAVFNDFSWLKADGTKVAAKNVKAIVYTQYPEARLSGLEAVDNTMPQSLSITYTKAHPESKRLLVLAHLPGGACVGLVYLGVSDALLAEILSLPSFAGSKVCKLLSITQNYSAQLFAQLAQLVSKSHKGCRLNAKGETIPFTGTQVCGYTLEHALGIVPNSDKDGDLYGIELKTHTQVKVTLFTPEPDFGVYADSFETFMRTYGYSNDGGNEFRVTGVHRANIRCEKSGLTLRVREYRVNNGEWIKDGNGNRKPFPYDQNTSLTSKLDAVEVVLLDEDGVTAAGWTFERLMNNWGAKHNEVVYIAAEKLPNKNLEEVAQGYEFEVTFSPKVIWCKETSPERLLSAIDKGVIFLDPAPKFVASDASKNKRRAQWRVNDVTKAVETLYESVEVQSLGA